MNYIISKCVYRSTQGVMRPSSEENDKITTRGQKAHNEHLSTMCHLFDESASCHFCLLIGRKNRNLVGDVEILLPDKFHGIPFSGLRE